MRRGSTSRRFPRHHLPRRQRTITLDVWKTVAGRNRSHRSLGASPLTLAKDSPLLPAELAHACHGGRLSAQTVLGMRLSRRTAPSACKQGTREAPARLRSRERFRPAPLNYSTSRKEESVSAVPEVNIAVALGTRKWRRAWLSAQASDSEA
jgi:hypothetical protein